MEATTPTPNAVAEDFTDRPNRPHTVAARFTDDELLVLDRHAAELHLSRAQFVRAAIGRFVSTLPN